MAERQASVALSGNEWTLIAEYEGVNLPRQVAVVNHADSTAYCEVLVLPIHGTDAPGGGDQGVPVLVGSSVIFTAHVPNAGGAIKAVYARSTDADVGVGEVMR